ncbi:hypothetical protein LXA43DRAFT_1088492 [Ganoderma leucocontextum]|nr:hypothetical protein LXA43DRAFT_1088492 [Ganoderma leucocontextum]
MDSVDAFNKQALLKRNAVPNFEWDIAETVLSSVLYGVFVVLILAAVPTLIYKGPRRPVNLLLAAVLFSLFASTSLHFATNIIGQHVSVLMDAMIAFGTEADMSAHADYLRYNWNVASCGETVALTVNILLGDAIVWWRACVLWRANWIIRLLCAGFLITTADMDPESWGEGKGNMYEGVSYGIAATVLSLATNVLATSLIGYKFWEHGHILKKYIVIGPRIRRLEKVLCLLVESGITYCLLWIVVVIWHVQADTGPPGVTNPWSFYNVFAIVIDGGLVQLIAIYPMLIIVLVALERSTFDNGVHVHRAVTIDSPPRGRDSGLSSSLPVNETRTLARSTARPSLTHTHSTSLVDAHATAQKNGGIWSV